MAGKMTPEQIAHALAGGKRPLLIDVRDSAQIAQKGTIEGSSNIPAKELENRLADVPKDRPIITV